MEVIKERGKDHKKSQKSQKITKVHKNAFGKIVPSYAIAQEYHGVIFNLIEFFRQKAKYLLCTMTIEYHSAKNRYYKTFKQHLILVSLQFNTAKLHLEIMQLFCKKVDLLT